MNKKRLWCMMRRSLLLIFALPCVYLLLAFALSHIVVNQVEKQEGRYSLYLVSNGVHSDIVMPLVNDVMDWRAIVSPNDTLSQIEMPLIAIGWGEREFYLNTPTWSDLKASTALKAIFGFNSTLLHVSFYHYEHLPLMHDYVELHISREQYQQLSAEILKSFVLKDGRAQALPNAHQHDLDAFYLAYGRYHLFNTCNTWSNRQLKRSGIKAVLWTPFAHSLLAVQR